MTIDYLLVGQGLAGSVLSHILLENGLTIRVVDAQTLPAASAVAAGVYNPLTGKKLQKTWRADVLFPYLTTFYQRLEKILGEQVLYPKSIYRPFRSIEEQNLFLSLTATPERQPYVQESTHNETYSAFIHNSLGALETKQSGFVDVYKLLRLYRQYLKKKGILVPVNWNRQALRIEPDFIEWHGIRAQKILFCEGVHAVNNPLWSWLPLRPVKGEVLSVETDTDIPDTIFKQGVFMLPTQGRQAKVGATYQWDNLDWIPTEAARREMADKLAAMVKAPFRVMDQRAGLRPTTPDRRPFIGLHPEFAAVGIFNGLGSKGVSLAPYFAQQFFEALEHGQELDSEVNISRYFSLYFHLSTPED